MTNPIALTDNFDAICQTLETSLMQIAPQLKYAIQGWPDPTWFEDTGVNFPSVFFNDVSTVGNAARSRISPYVTDAANIYYETLRQQLLIQITLIASIPEDRISIGSQIIQYLVNQRQLAISNGQYSIVRFKGDVSPKGGKNFYLRHMTFEFQTRILQAVQAVPVNTINSNKTISGS